MANLSQLLTILSWAFRWTALFMVEWASRIVSTFHAVLTAGFATYYICSGEIALYHSFDAVHRMWFLTVQMSMGYFLYDAVLVAFCFPNKAEKWQTLFHHSLAYLLHYVPVCVYKVFFAISAMGYLSEVSTPFLNTRWMLLQGGKGNTQGFMINGGCLAISFFVCRLLCGIVILYQVFVAVPEQGPESPTFESAMGPTLAKSIQGGVLAFYVLNIYWFSMIVQGVKKALGGKYKRED